MANETIARTAFNSFIDVSTLDKNRPRTVVFYGRVSTEHEAQLAALENQVKWYDDEAERHPNWTVVDRYIDEGITGTQAKKRPAFLRMIEDAKNGKFDLIVTREVCRFARNVVDTLNYTRMLKGIGVEVYFVSDHIHTFDNDGELRLSLMATLAQEESRKVSERVKAGQKISRDNGRLYGSGNILGYDLDKEHNTYVINPEQAETVRMIYKMYSEGEGSMRIANKLTEMKRLNASGIVKWESCVILRILSNGTYMGCKSYNKSRSNNYLEQKRINNRDEESYIYKKGDFEPIISEELWYKCYDLRKSKSKPSVVVNGVPQKISRRTSKDFWTTKLRCSCGSKFRKDPWHKYKDGRFTFGYTCYNRLNNGKASLREKNGLDTEGFCNMPMICDWKLDLMEHEIFSKIQIDKIGIASQLVELIKENYEPDLADGADRSRNYLQNQRMHLEQKRKNIMNMRAEGELDKDEYIEMKRAVEAELEKLTEQEKNIADQRSKQEELFVQLGRIENVLKEYAETVDSDFEKEVRRNLISSVTPVSNEHFIWELSLNRSESTQLHCNVQGRKNKAVVRIDEFSDGDEVSPLHKKSNRPDILHRLLSTKASNSQIRSNRLFYAISGRC